MSEPVVLGIESTCDETAAAIVRGRELLSNVVASSMEEHARYGGVIPEIASRAHAEAFVPCVSKALVDANMTLADVDAIAVSAGPGLAGCLAVGVSGAKALAWAANKPIYGINHVIGHIAVTQLQFGPFPKDTLALIVSGGHTSLLHVEDMPRKIDVVGTTLDDAAGECFDKAARAMGLPYPGGVHLDRLAADGDPGTYPLPHPRVAGSPYDFSFSGLKTAVLNLLHNAEQRGESVCLPDLAASFRKTVVDQLAGNLLRAAEDTGARTLVLAGGVSANAGLRARMEEEAARRGLTLYLPPLSLCGDNGAMVGAQAYYEYRAGARAGLDLNAAATMPIA